ncbi:hypothetical protein [Edwardsiella tarda]
MMRHLRLLFSFIKTIDLTYHAIGVGSLLLLFAKVIWFNEIPAPLPFMAKIGAVFEGVLGSIVASYIFYIFCIYPSIFKDKKTSALFVSSILNEIIIGFQSYMNDVSKDITTESSIRDIRAAFLKISPYQRNAPLILNLSENKQLSHASWLQFFQYSNNLILNSIKKVMDSRLFLDAELIHILNQISNCKWFSIIQLYSSLNIHLNGSLFVNSQDNENQVCDDFYHLKELINNLEIIKSNLDRFIIK